MSRENKSYEYFIAVSKKDLQKCQGSRAMPAKTKHARESDAMVVSDERSTVLRFSSPLETKALLVSIASISVNLFNATRYSNPMGVVRYSLKLRISINPFSTN